MNPRRLGWGRAPGQAAVVYLSDWRMKCTRKGAEGGTPRTEDRGRALEKRLVTGKPEKVPKSRGGGKRASPAPCSPRLRVGRRSSGPPGAPSSFPGTFTEGTCPQINPLQGFNKRGDLAKDFPPPGVVTVGISKSQRSSRQKLRNSVLWGLIEFLGFQPICLTLGAARDALCSE